MLNKLFDMYGISTAASGPEEKVPLDMFAGEFVGQCSPIIRWVGGKTQLLPALRFYAPKKFGAYLEPFLGGGALLFSLMPKRAVVSDANDVLASLYRHVRDDYEMLVKTLDAMSRLPETESVYLAVRHMYNESVLKGVCSLEVSAMFMFLNAKGFNSLYRVNSKGEFNVAYRKDYKIPPIYAPEALKFVHEYLSGNDVDVLSGDFMKCSEKANEGDFVYFDPPYAPVSDTKCFTSYSQDGFTAEDQERLAKEFRRLTDKGVKCMMSNSDCEAVRDLYKGFVIRDLNVNYCINPNSDDIKRRECLILNY